MKLSTTTARLLVQNAEALKATGRLESPLGGAWDREALLRSVDKADSLDLSRRAGRPLLTVHNARTGANQVYVSSPKALELLTA